MNEKDIFKMFDYIADETENNNSCSNGGGEYISTSDSVNTEHISKFICENFSVSNPHIFNELLSETVHLDVFCAPPTDKKPYYVLMTSGMSDRPVENMRSELMMLLPKDWNIQSTASTLWNWPINILKKAARYPHTCNKPLAAGSHIQFEAFSENTQLCSLVFVQPSDEKLRVTAGENGTTINVLIAVPIYKEELEFKLANGAEALLERIFGTGEIPDSAYVVDINRKNSCI